MDAEVDFKIDFDDKYERRVDEQVDKSSWVYVGFLCQATNWTWSWSQVGFKSDAPLIESRLNRGI